MRRFLAYLVVGIFWACSPVLAQDEAPGFNTAKARIATALLSSEVVKDWAGGREAEESVAVEVVLALKTDSTGTVREVSVLSAQGFDVEARRELSEVIQPLVLPELASYNDVLSFTLRREPAEEKRLSPVLAGVIAGLTVGVAAVLLLLSE